MKPREKAYLQNDLEIDCELDRRLCIQSFYHFVKRFWHVIEPATAFVPGWHIRAIALHLEAVAEFQIMKMIINMPPRHMKSILGCVLFPAWVWLKYPSRRFLYCSYAESLAIRDSVKTRYLIESEEYRSTFQPDWLLRDDQNQRKNFENTLGGARFSAGVGGLLTGMGGDHLFIDDPINAVEANSEPVREHANFWHDTAFSSRYNDPKRHSKVIIMQRLHEKDLTGHILELGDRYDRLILPARYNPESENKSKTTLNWNDPRKIKGELLWPERFDERSITDLETDLNRYDDNAEAQLQQEPKPRKGGLFPRDHWIEYDAFPEKILEIVQFVDAAQKPGISNDYSVIATWAKCQNGYYLLDLWRDKTDMPTLEEIVKTYFTKWRPNAVVIEDKSGGSSLIQYLLRSTAIPVIPYDPGSRDKELRASAATPTVKAGKCFLPKGMKWVKDFKSEHEKFPKGSNDDMVDTTSMMVDYWGRRIGIEPRIRQL